MNFKNTIFYNFWWCILSFPINWAIDGFSGAVDTFLLRWSLNISKE